ncbi:MAG: aminotransferase class V-fold PLP-dependent enzyme, partial [Planctomycetota bacterium]
MPGYCDGGSVDRFALAGLAAAIRWLDEPAQHDRLTQCRRLIDELRKMLEGLPRIQLYGNENASLKIPTLAFNFEGRDSTRIASRLRDHGVFVGSGLQCAPLAHESLGTSLTGTVRLSVGPQTTEQEVFQASELIALLADDSVE